MEWHVAPRNTTGFSLSLWKNAWNALDVVGVGDILRRYHQQLHGIVTTSLVTGKQIEVKSFKPTENQEVRRVALNRGVEYLEQDFRLIAFAAYLGSEAFDGFCGQGESRMTFKVWLHQRPEVQAMK
ncbi:uncharacterized protein LOC124845774 [Vigna umbellata]|uniref:uncharacterized protein LOC124845774 n=1 Tax=Vigna umbellata TaxID=87088 RepID=UPI001F5F1254|nr:uncharacterized protein LOC124845774 [Vigna umbellata]XP_047178893.1 uncharacterized protein LOC124845774 [Vigna umbellata]